MTVRIAMLAALCVLLACDPPPRPPVTVPQPTDELSCELKVRSIGTRLGLAFMIHAQA